jgi:two-component system sensor histidine kinase UhpB
MALQLQLSVLEGHLGEGADPNVMADRLRAVSGILGSTIESSAKISTQLRPSLLDNAGLAATLDWHAQTFASRTGIRVHFDALEDVLAAPEISIATFRIFQDTLTNVERHSQAAEVRITLRGAGGRLMLKVSDNGWGIPREKVVAPPNLSAFSLCVNWRFAVVA